MRKIRLSLVTIIFATSLTHAQASSTHEETIQSIHNAFKKHEITCEGFITKYLTRIKTYNLSTNSHAPLNAFTTINTNVIEQAKKLDTTYAKTNKLKPLHCIPVILKDNIDSYDSTSTSGSLALLGNQPNRDAFLVTKLREAGAVIIGKGGMDELASGMYGINGRNGRVGNAYNPDLNPGGSSGGPAVAVSTNLSMIGIGTDNSGSVRVPAAFNGIYGLRPSTGLISQNGIFPTGNLDGTAGPLARTVEDLARTLDVIANKSKDLTYTTYLKKQGLKGKRIGIVHSVGKVNTYDALPADIRLIFGQALQTMKASGAEVVDNIKLAEYDNNRNDNSAGMSQDINAYLLAFPSVRKNTQDLCQSDRTRTYGNRKECLKFFNTLPTKSGKKYRDALNRFKKNKMYVDKVMKEHHLDALLVLISTTGIATYDLYKINTWQAPIASNAGLPAITINLGYSTDKMPIGTELIGMQYSEGNLIEIAYGYEQNSPSRVIPALPEPTNAFANVDIAGYNNLLTNIGYRSYYQVLIKHNPDKYWKELSPAIFKDIVNRESRYFFDRAADARRSFLKPM